MAQLSDLIEHFIKGMMEDDSQIEVRRNELAAHFGCAPSQINYVLATRFSENHGYIIESRRGGGGFVRIIRVQIQGKDDLYTSLMTRIGNTITEEAAKAIIAQLQEAKLLTAREAGLMESAILNSAMALPVAGKDILRAAVLKSMIKQVFLNLEEDKHDL